MQYKDVQTQDLYDDIKEYVISHRLSDLFTVLNDVIETLEDYQEDTIRLEMENEYGEYKNKYMAISKIVNQKC